EWLTEEPTGTWPERLARVESDDLPMLLGIWQHDTKALAVPVTDTINAPDLASAARAHPAEPAATAACAGDSVGWPTGDQPPRPQHPPPLSIGHPPDPPSVHRPPPIHQTHHRFPPPPDPPPVSTGRHRSTGPTTGFHRPVFPRSGSTAPTSPAPR